MLPSLIPLKRNKATNNAHSNYRGAMKVTSFICEYLIENFGLTDKRGNPKYADWDEAAANYYHKILAKRLDEEDMKYFKSPIPEKP